MFQIEFVYEYILLVIDIINKMYLTLSQQKFVPNQTTCRGALNQVAFYGDPLYIATDLSHFVYQNVRHPIVLKGVYDDMGIHNSNAISGRKGRIDSHFRQYIYDVMNILEPIYFIIVQTKDNNTYLHNKYEFAYVTYMGMRFEPVNHIPNDYRPLNTWICTPP